MSDKLQGSSIILGVDVGTTCCKCTAFDSDFKVLAEASREYQLIHSADGWVEQDPKVWWGAAQETIGEAADLSKNHGTVTGIGVSSQGISFVPVDINGNPLMNALTWLDMRAGAQCSQLKKAAGEELIYRTTGKRINPAYTLPKVMWLRENEPEIYENTYKFLTAHDYIIFRLSGNYVTEDSIAAGTMAYDITKKRWDPDILEFAGVSLDKMPEIYQSGTAVGYLTSENLLEMGLEEGVLISTGGQDQKCAALGSGLSSKCVTVSLGTSCAITALFDEPVFLEDMSLPCFPYIDGKSWVLEGFGSTAGASVKWFRDNLGSKQSYKEIDGSIASLYDSEKLPDNVIFFPYLGGTASPEWYDAKGGGFLGITLDTSNSQMAAAVLESVAFNIRANLEKMESLGKSFSSISVFGGGASSEIWLMIISDITGREVRIPYLEECACLGAAIMCSRALGQSHFPEPAVRRIFYPDLKKTKRYETKYREYKKLENKIFGGV